jgi:hypothetical protein
MGADLRRRPRALSTKATSPHPYSLISFPLLEISHPSFGCILNFIAVSIVIDVMHLIM